MFVSGSSPFAPGCSKTARQRLNKTYKALQYFRCGDPRRRAIWGAQVSSSSFRYVVRIARTDLDGTLKLERALSDIKGVGQRFARAVTQAAGLSPDQRMGYVTDADVAKIEEVLKDPVKFGIPGWMVNRRKDMATGQDKHLVGSDLEFQLRTDIDGLMKIKSWRGVRHSLGLKVRGQRTRSTGRTGRAVGVTRKKE